MTENLIRRIPFRLVVIFLQIILFAVGTLGIKFTIGNLLRVKDDVIFFVCYKFEFD